jgi:alpha-galactosidase
MLRFGVRNMLIGMTLSLSLIGCGSGDRGVAGADPTPTPDVPPVSNVTTQIAVPPPPMGWSSWNTLADTVSYSLVKAQVDGLVALNAQITSGAKYEYANADEGWWITKKRDANGKFIVDTTQWPGGMQAMAQYIHGKGLKAGIYIDAGPQGCGTLPDGSRFVGSDPSHYDSDFLQFAQWGYDFVKVDFCGGQTLNYDPQATYTAISQAIQKAYLQTGQLVALGICDWGTISAIPGYPDYMQGPWAWGAGVGTMWRNTVDIYHPSTHAPPIFASVVANFNGNVHPEGQHTGYYNDPDLMVAGMGMSDVNDQAQVSMWAISGAPMLLGNDLSKPLTSATLSLLTNPEMIAIDQDPLGLQGLLVAKPGAGLQVWSKLLTGTGRRAVMLFNSTAADAPVAVTWDDLGLVASSQVTVRDVFAQKDRGAFTTSYTAPNVPAGGVTMLVVGGSDTPAVTYTPGVLQSGSVYKSCPACVSGKIVTGLGSVAFNNVAWNTNGGFVQIAYVNSGNQTVKAQLSVNGKGLTTLAFPPSGSDGGVGTITVYALLQQGQNSLTLSSLDSSTPAPEISSIATVAGPVPLQPFNAAYEAEAPGNTLAGGANVADCVPCSGGSKIGNIGNKGTLTINGISVPSDGTYTVPIAFMSASPMRSAQISFNGATPVTMNAPSTGGWTNSSTLSVTGTFKAGASNTLEISNPSGPAPDIDGIGAPVLQSP